jgi:CRP-like cAMP-binding protein
LQPASPDQHFPRENHLLAALPQAEFDRIVPSLELVSLTLGEVLHESGGRMEHIYFPVNAIVSLLYLMENGSSAEIAVVGREGVVGVALFMGGGTMPNRTVVQSEGHAFRMQGQHLRREFDRAGVLQHLLLRSTLAMLSQMSQTAVCNRHHSLDQQLCRWLLLSLDRLSSNDLSMSQDLISSMLGVTEARVAEAAAVLQNAGLILRANGRVTVLDRPGVEARVCECYDVVRREFARLLPELITP